MINSRGSNEEGELELKKKPGFIEKEGFSNELIQKLTWPGKPLREIVLEIKEYELDATMMAKGRQKYLNLCASCHGTQGEGMKRFAPPLKKSEWVLGEGYTLAMILLHGMEGPVSVNGKRYDIPEILPSMPSFSTLQNEDIAAISTYIRNSWGHSAPPISSGTIGHIRYRTQGQITPWKASELDSLIFDVE